MKEFALTWVHPWVDLAEKPMYLVHVQGHEYFILTKYHKYPSSSSVVKADYMFPYPLPKYMYMQIYKTRLSVETGSSTGLFSFIKSQTF